MSYLVLARKYRPQTFEDLVGQSHVVTTLQNALKQKRVAHAYVFSGPRGCGKTTLARLLSKALNCTQGPTSTPCGQCPFCLEIAAGQNVDDVLEIDGASNRGIDQIRELRDMVKYAPARGRYRVVIIDEAHQITDAGFNALLKTLEEPPAHAVFMLATTESQKIPPTILSRCQRFHLRSIPLAEMVQRMEAVVKTEKLTAGAAALQAVAKAAGGSLRDALSLLDQVVAYAPGGIGTEDIQQLLGLLPQETVKRFAESIEAGTPEGVLSAVQEAFEKGTDLHQLAEGLMHHWHEVLLAKCNVFLGGTDPAAWKAEAQRHTVPELERRLLILSRCLTEMKRSEAPRVVFELHALDLAKRTFSVDVLLSRLEALEKGLPAAAGQMGAAALPPPAAPPLAAPAAPPVNAAPSTAPEAKTDPLSVTLSTAWPRVLGEVGAKKGSLENFLRSARCEAQGENTVRILCQNEFQKLQITTHAALIQDIAKKYFPTPVLFQCVLDPRSPPAALAPPPPTRATSINEDAIPLEAEVEDAAPPPMTPVGQTGTSDAGVLAAEEDPGLKKLMGKFPGKLRKIDSVNE